MNFANHGISGPDVSFYQDSDGTPQQIDFKRMKEAGARFVIIRAGQNNWSDPDFVYNWREAKAAGIPRGSYWFYDSRVGPKFQAEKWWSLVKDDPGEIVHFLDLEEHYGGEWQAWQYWYDCLYRFQQISGLPNERIGIYTNFYWWVERAPLSEINLAWFKRFPLWLASYSTQAQARIPAPWTECLFWQYGTPPVGIAYGAESVELDMNFFNGDVNTFNSYFRLGGEVIIQPPTEQPQGAIMARNQVTVTWSEGCRERSAPSILGTPYSILPAGSVHYSDFDEVPDQADPANPDKRWILLQSGKYVAVRYPSSSGVVRAVVTSMGATPQPGAPEYVTLHYADGTMLKYVPE